MRSMVPLALLACFPLLACASSPPPGASTGAAAPATSSTDTASSPAVSSATEAPPPAHVRPLDLTNDCPHEVHLYYGEQPGDGKGQSATVATGASVPVPRAPDGTVVVWVVDDKGFGLASVHITKNMRHIRFDTACGKLDADSKR